MLYHPAVNDILTRRKRLDAALRKGTLTAGDGAALLDRYAWVISKDGSKLGLGHIGAAEPNLADDEQASIPFTITTFEEDRDGDLVVPMGGQFENFKRNAGGIIFFGHQEASPIPIAHATSSDGRFCVWPEENRVRSVAHFDKGDGDAMFLYGKCKRGFLGAASVAFVPIEAYRRDREQEKWDNPDKARTHHEPLQPPGWLFKKWDMTEWSIVGVPSNAGAIRDALDTEKSFITPRLQKAMRPYAAEARGCWNGWCPCPAQEKAMKTVEKGPGEFGGKVLQVTNVRGGRGRFDSCTDTAQMVAKLKPGERLVKTTYGSGTQVEVRGSSNPTGAMFDSGARGIVATAQIVGEKSSAVVVAKSSRFATWEQARAEAVKLANQTKLDVAIRRIREYGKDGFNVSFASKNDSDYARAEIVKPAAKSLTSRLQKGTPKESSMGQKALQFEQYIHDLGSKSARSQVRKYITHTGSQWIVHAEDGKVLGKHPTKEQAEAQLRAVEANKHKSVRKTANLTTEEQQALDAFLAWFKGKWQDASGDDIQRYAAQHGGSNAYAVIARAIGKLRRGSMKAAKGVKKSTQGEIQDILDRHGLEAVIISNYQTGHTITPTAPTTLRAVADALTRSGISAQVVGGKVVAKALNESSATAGGYTVSDDPAASAEHASQTVCGWCGGDGNCATCEGVGEVESEPCAVCGGSGDCKACTGTGAEMKSIKNSEGTNMAKRTNKTMPAKGCSTEAAAKGRRRKSADEEDKDLETQATDYDEKSVDVVGETGGAVEEPFNPKPSAISATKLYNHLKEADAWVDGELKDMDHPGMAEGLQKFKDEHLEPATEAVKDMLHEHHGEGDDADETLAKHQKALEDQEKGIDTSGEAETGEEGMVDAGDVPPEEAKDMCSRCGAEWSPEESVCSQCGADAHFRKDAEDAEEKSEIGSEEWAEEEAEEPEHKDETEPDTEEILERYRTPKGWATRKVGVARRAKDGKRYLVREKVETAKPVRKDAQDWAESHGTAMDPGSRVFAKDEHLDTIKDAAEHMEAVADDQTVPKYHQSSLRMHAKALHGVHKDLSETGYETPAEESTLSQEPETVKEGIKKTLMRCPKCRSQVDEDDQEEGTCSVCGADLYAPRKKGGEDEEEGKCSKGKKAAPAKPVSKAVEKRFAEMTRVIAQHTGIGLKNGNN